MSWKTTLTGLGAIVAQIAAILWPAHAPQLQAASTLLTGAGLVAARDNNKSSEDVGAK